jgi:uncharacterized protein YggE
MPRTAAFLLTLVLALLATDVVAQEQPPRIRSISTMGEAVVYVVPDEVIVTLGIETFHKDLDQAVRTSDEMAERLLPAIKGLGVETKHIQTQNLEVEVRYHDYNSSQFGVEGYVTRRMYTVTLKDTKLFERLVTTALKSGANRLLGFEYRTSELRKHRDEARKMAIRAAREKAVALTGELGCGLGKPNTIGEGYYGYAGMWSSRWNWGANAQAQVAAQAPGGGDGGAGDEGGIAPLGQIGVRAQINVTFELVD